MRKLVVPIFVALLPAALLPGAEAGPVTVTVRDNEYDPANTRAAVGQEVLWETSPSTADEHNVRENRRIFYSGAPEFELTFERVFSAGTFRYFCEIHDVVGMIGTVKVPVKLASAPPGPAFTVTWATTASNTGTKYTIQYRIGSGTWKTWKSSTSAVRSTFKEAQAGRRYTFRAKSLKGDAASKWSPVVSISV